MFLFYTLVLGLVSNSLGIPLNPLSEYQDSIGQYSFGYSGPQSARSEIRSADGKTRGAFSFVDDSGILQTAQYTADSENGFRIAATNLPQAPQPVQDTPEVIAAREAHLKAVEEARKIAEDNEAPVIVEGSKDMMPMEGLGGRGISKIEEQRGSDAVILENEDMAKTGEEKVINMAPQGEVMSRNAESKNSQRILSGAQKVPLVKTSFVIPGSKINLRSRIELSSGQSYGAPSGTVSQGIIGGPGIIGRKTLDKSGSAGIITGFSPYSSLLFSPYAPKVYPYAHYHFIPTFSHIF